MTDEQLVNGPRLIEQSRASNEVRAAAGAAADRIEALSDALALNIMRALATDKKEA